MWPYLFLSREEFEKRKDFVETVLCDLGCVDEYIVLPYAQRETSHGKQFCNTWISERPVYRLDRRYIRVSEVLLDKPFIVLEISDTLQDVSSNAMEDAGLFPYDLTDDQIRNEIRIALEE